MIPKVINYCWFGNNPLPKDVKKCVESWKKYCPDYKIIQWNEQNFDIECHPFIKTAYAAGAWAFVSDYARLKIIHDHGGIYLDTDVELLKSLNLVLNNECFVAVQQGGHYINTGLGFGAEAYHPMVKTMIDQYDGLTFENENKKNLICPILNTNAFVQVGFVYKEDIQCVKNAYVYPPKYFDPYASSDQAEDLLCSDTISIHHYSATWTTGKQRIKRKIARFIGEGTIIKIKKFLKG